VDLLGLQSLSHIEERPYQEGETVFNQGTAVGVWREGAIQTFGEQRYDIVENAPAPSYLPFDWTPERAAHFWAEHPEEAELLYESSKEQIAESGRQKVAARKSAEAQHFKKVMSMAEESITTMTVAYLATFAVGFNLVAVGATGGVALSGGGLLATGGGTATPAAASGATALVAVAAAGSRVVVHIGGELEAAAGEIVVNPGRPAMPLTTIARLTGAMVLKSRGQAMPLTSSCADIIQVRKVPVNFDLSQMASEIARVLKPGGTAQISFHSPVMKQFAELLSKEGMIIETILSNIFVQARKP